MRPSDTGTLPASQRNTPWAVPQYATPWRVEVFDGRVFLLARDGETVTKVQPGQVNGRIMPLDERKALGQRIANAVNDHLMTMTLPAETARSPDAPWLKPICGEAEDGA